MEQKKHEMGAQAVFLASCARKFIVPFASPVKKFNIFNSDVLFSIKIKDGIGTMAVPHCETRKGAEPSEEIQYDDLFEIENGKISDNEYPEIAANALKIFNHLKEQVANLYFTKVINLHLAFSIFLNGESIIHLTDVFSCIIEEHDYYPLFENVPDGCDIVSQISILYARYRFLENQCLCFRNCDGRCPKATLGATLQYKISELFFDCSVEQLTPLIKKIIRSININCFNEPLTLCPQCYNNYMLFESQKIKETQMLQRSSMQIQEERRRQIMEKKPKKCRKHNKPNFSQTSPLHMAGRSLLGVPSRQQQISNGKSFDSTMPIESYHINCSMKKDNGHRKKQHRKEGLCSMSNPYF